MRALYQRKKGRDLFDLLTMLDEHRDMDPQKIVHCFEQYCQFQGISVSRAQFEQNLGEKMQDAEFMADITTVVKPGLTYDHAAAVEVVQDRLVSLLRGKPFKKA